SRGSSIPRGSPAAGGKWRNFLEVSMPVKPGSRASRRPMRGTITKVHGQYCGQQPGGAITIEGQKDRVSFLEASLVYLDLRADRLLGMEVDFDVAENQAYRVRRAKVAAVEPVA